ncbi:MAG: hypothetical protein DRJ38_05810 [Thermoprotei archaeon]|nr:MAG: hypothetical protein DRJ38_05810 [Thermoprotei archaeon]
MVKALRVVLELHWGYSVKHPFFSASQPSFRFPPPTTLIGALVFAIASRRNGVEILAESDGLYSYTAGLLNDVPWATCRVLNIDPRLLIETRDLSRVLIAPYVRSDNVYPGSQYLWAVQTHGKVYAPILTLDVVYMVKGSSVKDIARYAWGITRAGTKESIVSVRSVELLDINTIVDNIVETNYGFPRSLAEPVKGVYTETRLPIPSREWYRLGAVRDANLFLDDYVMPVDVVTVRIRDIGIALRVGDVGAVIVPREVVEHG